jgi:hypothetical protein
MERTVVLTSDGCDDGHVRTDEVCVASHLTRAVDSDFDDGMPMIGSYPENGPLQSSLNFEEKGYER